MHKYKPYSWDSHGQSSHDNHSLVHVTVAITSPYPTTTVKVVVKKSAKEQA